MKPDREKIILDIVSEMDLGVSYTQAKAINGEKWQVPQRTFDTYWAEASERYKDILEIERNARNEVRIQMAKDSLKKAILNRHERMELLTQIAKGDISFEKEVATKFGPITILQKPEFVDRRAAVAELNKMDGEYAPVKKELKGEIEIVKQITGIIVE